MFFVFRLREHKAHKHTQKEANTHTHNYTQKKKEDIRKELMKGEWDSSIENNQNILSNHMLPPNDLKSFLLSFKEGDTLKVVVFCVFCLAFFFQKTKKRNEIEFVCVCVFS